MNRFLLLCCLFLTQIAVADQYRSKLYLDKSQRLGESVELSLEDLESQFDSLSDSYSKSSAGRHLARNFVNQKRYDKAIEFYEKALRAEGLSAIANYEMLKELAMVYVLQKNYPKAVATFRKLRSTTIASDPQTLLLMAQAQVGMGDYLGMSKTLDALLPDIKSLDEGQLKLLAGLYYKGGNNKRSEKVLRRLLDINARSPEYWRQLTAILLAQNKRRQALDQLELARQKKIPFRSQDVVLLSDLYVANGAAEKGARVLARGIASGEVENSFGNNKRLFEFWLQAREKDKAIVALEKALGLNYDTELYLQLAQLQMERENWSGMRRAVLGACSRTLQDRYVSRANLLLGVSQLKQGNNDGARRAFINATLISGEAEKARQWLAFIGAAEPSSAELEAITKPCAPGEARVMSSRTARLLAGDAVPAAAETASSATIDGSLQTKLIPSQGFFTVGLDRDDGDLGAAMRSSATSLGIALVKGGGSIDGALTLLIDSHDNGEQDLRLGFPYRGQPSARGRFRIKKQDDFSCVYRQYQGPGSGVLDALKGFAAEAERAGYSLTGQQRMVINTAGTSGDQVSMELQLGIL